MTIRVAKDETFVEVGFSQAGKLLVSCGAAARGVKTAIEKEVDVVGTAAMDEWRGILTTTDEMDIDQQRRAGLLVERLNFGMEHYLSKRLEKLADWLVNSRTHELHLQDLRYRNDLLCTVCRHGNRCLD